jgi:hypothetical protein
VKQRKGPGMGGGRGWGLGGAFWLAPKHLLGGAAQALPGEGDVKAKAIYSCTVISCW